MASNVVKVRVDADAKGFVSEFKKAIKSPESFGVAVGTMAGNLVYDLGQRALSAVKDFVVDSVRAFSDLEQSLGGTEAVFGDASDTIDEFAQRSAQAVGLAESEFRTATTLIGGSLKRMTGDVNFAADASVELIQVAADAAATYGGTTKDAVDAFAAALRGEADPAERFNFDLKIGAVNAKAVALGLAESTSKVDANARAQATLALIMEQSADAQGQFGREADSLAGKQQRANAELENAKALFGEIIAPMKAANLEMQSGLINTLNTAAIALGGLTGELDDGRAALLAFKNETGDSVATVADVIEGVDIAWRSWTHEIDVWADSLFGSNRRLEDITQGIEALIEEEELGAEGMIELREEIALLGRTGDLTAEEVRILTQAINDEIVAHTNASRAAGQHRGDREKFKVATEGATGATEELTEAEKEAAKAAEEHRQKIIDLAAGFKTAFDEMTGVSEKSWDEITGDVEDFLTGFEEVPDETDLTMKEFERNFRKRAENLRTYWNTIHQLMGIEGTEALVNELIAQGPAAVGVAQQYLADPIRAQNESAFIESAEAGIANMVGIITGAKLPAIHVPLDVSTFRMRQLPTGEIVPSKVGSRQFAEGGIATEGFLDGNGSSRKEAVIPLENQTGIAFLAAALREAMGGVNGHTTSPSLYITLTGDIYGIDDLEQRITGALEKARRRGVAV